MGIGNPTMESDLVNLKNTICEISILLFKIIFLCNSSLAWLETLDRYRNYQWELWHIFLIIVKIFDTKTRRKSSEVIENGVLAFNEKWIVSWYVRCIKIKNNNHLTLVIDMTIDGLAGRSVSTVMLKNVEHVLFMIHWFFLYFDNIVADCITSPKLAHRNPSKYHSSSSVERHLISSTKFQHQGRRDCQKYWRKPIIPSVMKLLGIGPLFTSIITRNRRE